MGLGVMGWTVFAVMGSAGLLFFWWLHRRMMRDLHGNHESLEAQDEAEEELMERLGLDRRARRKKVDEDTQWATIVAAALMFALVVLPSTAAAFFYDGAWRLQLAVGLAGLVIGCLAVVTILRRRSGD